jgi:hypothetical protein
MKDLVVLVADKNMEYAIRGLLERRQSLGIRPITFNIHVHPERDSGCRSRGVEFLSPFCKQYTHALLILDFEGSGVDACMQETLERELEEGLRSAWERNGAVILVDPELDVWVWSDSPHVENILGWKGRTPVLRNWLVSRGFEFLHGKPTRPKEALEAALGEVKKPRSSKIYLELARRVGLKRCTNRSFVKLKNVIREWFK